MSLSDLVTRPRPKIPPSSGWGWIFIVSGTMLIIFMGFFAVIGSVMGIGDALFTLFTVPETKTITIVYQIGASLLMGLCMPAPFVPASGVLIYLGIRHIQRDKALKEYGRITQATVTNKWIRIWKGTKHYVTYEFQVQTSDGTLAHYQNAEFNRRAYKCYEIGDTAPLRYVPHDPTICRLEMTETAESRR